MLLLLWGGFLIADTIPGAIPEDMRKIAGALTASIAAIVAATYSVDGFSWNHDNSA